MSVVASLRASSKGKLVYRQKSDLLKLEHEVSPPLSRFHEEREMSKLRPSFGVQVEDNDEMCVNNRSLDPLQHKLVTPDKHEELVSTRQNIDEAVKPPVVEESVDLNGHHQQSPKPAIGFVSPLSSNHWDSLKVLKDAEESYNYHLQMSSLERIKVYKNHKENLAEQGRLKEHEAFKKLGRQLEMRKSSLERKHQKEKAEAIKTLESLKHNREKHREKMDTKQKEIEQRRLDLEREERKRQEYQEKLHEKLQVCLAQVEQNCLKFNQTLESCQHKDLLPAAVTKIKAKFGNVLAILPAKIQKAFQSGNITAQLVTEFEDHAEHSKLSVQSLQKQIEEVESQVKAATEKKKEEEAKQAEKKRKAEHAKKVESEAAQHFGVQALSFAMKERELSTNLLAQVEASIKSFTTNPQMKQYRFDIQRAVNTPINAISGIDVQHLRDKLRRLLSLLRGQEVEVSGRRVKADQTPESLLFCQNLVAKMLVRKGEEQVSSLHESAFPVAAVTLGIWSEFPVVGDLFMAHLRVLCPYVLPHYHTRQDGESNADYHRALAYKVDDQGTAEEQDKFLRRMSGLMRLYCACLVTSPPPAMPGRTTAPSSSHPHGLEHAWSWLARVMDQDPHPDITAALLYDMLVVAGPALMATYSLQFVKLIYLLFKQYLPKLQEVAVTSAALGRLRSFLDTFLQSGRIPQPDGILPPNFWRS